MSVTSRFRPRRLGLLALAIALLVAACGDDDGSDSTSDDAGPAAEGEQETESAAGTGTPDSAPAASTQPVPEVELEILTYNVAGLPAALSGSEPDVNTPLIGPRLNEYDLVLVQESWLTPDPNPTGLRTYHEILMEASSQEFASTPNPAPLGADPRRPSAQLSDGLNRFGEHSFDPDAITRRMWTTCGEASADCLSQKGFSMARTIIADGIEVDVYNLHMDAGRDDAAVRGENVAELIEFITSESAGRAVIVGGDFNLHLDRDPDREQFEALLAETGLIDVCTDLSCSEPNRIDKILVRSSDEVTISAVAWRNDGERFTRDDGEPLSDHEPVAAVVTLSGI